MAEALPKKYMYTYMPRIGVIGESMESNPTMPQSSLAMDFAPPPSDEEINRHLCLEIRRFHKYKLNQNRG